ncbi:hypothetical protein GCM10010399_48260 [Dactylosporangium fulvum]
MIARLCGCFIGQYCLGGLVIELLTADAAPLPQPARPAVSIPADLQDPHLVVVALQQWPEG